MEELYEFDENLFLSVLREELEELEEKKKRRKKGRGYKKSGRKKKKKKSKKRKLTSKPSSETNLRDWFKRKGSKGSAGGLISKYNLLVQVSEEESGHLT